MLSYLIEHMVAIRQNDCREEIMFMKGYAVESGYMGYVEGRYMLFASEMDYEDYMNDTEEL